MQEAADCLIGIYDFTGFGKVLPGDPRDPVKSMRSIVVQRLERGAGSEHGAQRERDAYVRVSESMADVITTTGLGKRRGVVTITATCDRFLWNMMRRISGATPDRDCARHF
jgi:tRNA U38,U39,U40 pseudouridine synthase TruA